jgi:DHA1 family multidrug resistance protein-like MFS transporter
MVVGVIIGFALMVAMNPSYGRKLKANNNIPVPEWRLPLAMIGAPVFAGKPPSSPPHKPYTVR